MDAVKWKIVYTALSSRLFVWILAVIADFVLPTHDAGVFLWTVTPQVPHPTKGDTLIGWLVDCLTRWDGQYFLHIANNGYTYESTLAFFPAFPILTRFAGEVVHYLQVDYGIIHFHTSLKIGALLVNLAFFTCAALALFELSKKVLKDEYLAYRAALYFCLNPASIFFSASYSESMYAAVSFFMMYRLEKSFSVYSAALLALASATRSNAIVNLGFVGYKCMRMIVKEIAIYKCLKSMKKDDLSTTIANILGDAIVPTVFHALATMAPFVTFQWYGFTQFCSLTKPSLDYDLVITEYASNNSLKLPSKEPSEWCSYQIPMPYSYIQSHYWGVGFLKYYHWKQIPNFMLAIPILYLVLSQAVKFYKQHRMYCLKLGLGLNHVNAFNKIDKNTNVYDMYGAGVLPKECLVYVVYTSFLAVFALLCIHVQVSTRLLCSSTPVIYWWASLMTLPKGKRPHKRDQPLESVDNLKSNWNNLVQDERPALTRDGLYLQNYFVIYAAVGTALFANFLPWT